MRIASFVMPLPHAPVRTAFRRVDFLSEHYERHILPVHFIRKTRQQASDEVRLNSMPIVAAATIRKRPLVRKIPHHAGADGHCGSGTSFSRRFRRYGSADRVRQLRMRTQRPVEFTKIGTFPRLPRVRAPQRIVFRIIAFPASALFCPGSTVGGDIR
jgi:hypothetical protein